MTTNEEKLLNINNKMAKELQAFVDDAKDSGSQLESVELLLKENDQVINSIVPWQNKIHKDCNNEVIHALKFK